MNDAVSETIQPSAPPERFQFSLKQLFIVSVIAGAGVVSSPQSTLVILILFGVFFVLWFALARWKNAALAVIVMIPLAMMVLGFTAMTRRRGPHFQQRSRSLMSAISMSLEKYRDDFRAYPPTAHILEIRIVTIPIATAFEN